jgi:hypothetical protein
MLALTDQLTWHAVPVSDFEDICFVQVYVVLVLSLYCCCFISWFSIVSNILILHCLKYLDSPLSQISWSSIVSNILILHCLKYLDPPLSQISWSSIVSSILILHCLKYLDPPLSQISFLHCIPWVCLSVKY